MIRWVHFRFFPVALALSLVLLVFNAGCIAGEPVSTEAAAAAKQMMAQIRARYGENKPITDDDYDKSLAVKCVNGTFVGTKTDDVVSYKGIPYVGQQPVGENRFKKPVPFEVDEGVYEAYHFARGCLQPISADDAGSLAVLGEDSLYLNIWKNTADTSEKKPVMVWIHGGGFTQGSTINPLYDGFNFVRDNGDVILVSIAYRLGGLGFLHLSHLPDGADYPDAQNLGILDQVMALRWVHENIAAFGGDPDNVTIFGESCGRLQRHVASTDPRGQELYPPRYRRERYARLYKLH